MSDGWSNRTPRGGEHEMTRLGRRPSRFPHFPIPNSTEMTSGAARQDDGLGQVGNGAQCALLLLCILYSADCALSFFLSPPFTILARAPLSVCYPVAVAAAARSYIHWRENCLGQCFRWLSLRERHSHGRATARAIRPRGKGKKRLVKTIGGRQSAASTSHNSPSATGNWPLTDHVIANITRSIRNFTNNRATICR
jgi:hypothetical protein